MLARFCEHFSCGGFFEINLNGCVPAESASRACVSWLMYGLRHSRFSAPLTEFYLKIYLGISAMLFEKQIHPGWSIFVSTQIPICAYTSG
jgi:hypothetical protein